MMLRQLRRPGAKAAATAAGLTVLTSAGLLGAVLRGWGRAEDPTDGEPLWLPDGEDTIVTTSDGAELTVRIAGAGSSPTVVFVHCWTGDRRVWGPVARLLVAEGYRVVLYDHRGHGQSTVGEAGLTLDAIADDLRDVLEATAAHEAVIAGHSLGGMATQQFAISYPEMVRARVAGIVLVGTACDRVARKGLHQRVAKLLIGHPLLERLFALSFLAPVLVRRTVGRTACMPHLRAVSDAFVATPGEVRAELLAAMYAMDLSAQLQHIDVPVTVVAGERDRLTPPSRSRRIADRIPGAQLTTLPDVGHMLPIEAPTEVADAIRAMTPQLDPHVEMTPDAAVAS